MKSKKNSDKNDPIEADIVHYHTDDEAYLSSYRAYHGPGTDHNGVPLSTISVISTPDSADSASYTRETLSSDSFIQERPSSYHVLSCVSALLCCCPVGVAALWYSCRARWAKNDGEFSQARVLGRQARDIAIASIILGIFLLLVTLLILILIWQTVGFRK